MSMHFTAASSQHLDLDPLDPLMNAAYTIGGWARMASFPATAAALFVGQKGGATPSFDRLVYQSTGWAQRESSVGAVNDGTVLTAAGTGWMWVGIGRPDAVSGLTMFAGRTPSTIASVSTTAARDVSARGAGNVFTLGSGWSSSAGIWFFDGDLLGWKWWQGSFLTVAQLKAEAAQLSPVITTNLKWWWPLIGPNSPLLSNPAGGDLKASGGPVASIDTLLPTDMWELTQPASLDPRQTRRRRVLAPTLRQMA